MRMIRYYPLWTSVDASEPLGKVLEGWWSTKVWTRPWLWGSGEFRCINWGLKVASACPSNEDDKILFSLDKCGRFWASRESVKRVWWSTKVWTGPWLWGSREFGFLTRIGVHWGLKVASACLSDEDDKILSSLDKCGRFWASREGVRRFWWSTKV